MQQKRICNSNGLISPAEYARSRKLNRSTISRQIASGKIPVHGGLVNADEADQARENNLSILHGRNTLRQRRELMATEDQAAPAGGPPIDQLRALWAAGYRTGQVSAIYDVRKSSPVLAIAEVGLGIGLSLEQAIMMARWYSALLLIWADPDADELKRLLEQDDPDWQGLAARIGATVTPAEIQSWWKKSGRSTDKWSKRYPREESNSN